MLAALLLAVANAQQLIHEVPMRCPPAAEKAVKEGDVVLRCRACDTNLEDRKDFLEKATKAYGEQLNKTIFHGCK